MAADPSLSPNERIGFPDSYRVGFEDAIHADILRKLDVLDQPGRIVLDIGPGCAALPLRMIEDCASLQHELLLLDSAEMLARIPDAPHVRKLPGFYPECQEVLQPWIGRIDAIVCYSVFHYIFVEARFWRFIDLSLELLAPGGKMLIGDIPNISKRKRFFASDNGVRFHQAFMNTQDRPAVNFSAIEHDKIDDAAIFGVLMRIRAQGCDGYWLPQPASLPMANRREDLLICKP